ncbi:hypothetical protein SESBI_17251 [Sesbania bispinosa]|nr:hypothetical protein SESBI_17251 [Sesbania bispinosa]
MFQLEIARTSPIPNPRFRFVKGSGLLVLPPFCICASGSSKATSYTTTRVPVSFATPPAAVCVASPFTSTRRSHPPLSFHCHSRLSVIQPLDQNCKVSMSTDLETIEGRITSMLSQLQSECGILQRMVYKNKNQHRRCSYFQRLLKVRRDLRLLQSENLEELVTSCFLVIKGDRPKQKVHLLESLKRRKCNDEKHNFLERLLGAARLLAEILLDVVSLFNTVSSLSRKKQSIKITHEGIEVFREFYPVSDDFVMLECVWKLDKFILLERKHKRENESQNDDSGGNLSVQSSGVNYDSIESFLGDDQLVSERVETHATAKEDLSHVKDMNTDLLTGLSQFDDGKETISSGGEGENRGTTKASFSESSPEAGLHALSRSSTISKLHSGSKKVAFVSIKNPTSAPQSVQSISVLPTNVKGFHSMGNENDQTKDDMGDSLASLLANANPKDSLF